LALQIRQRIEQLSHSGLNRPAGVVSPRAADPKAIRSISVTLANCASLSFPMNDTNCQATLGCDILDFPNGQPLSMT
jgi:hypothetical protein